MSSEEEPGETLRIGKSVYGGDGLARGATGEAVFLPLTLPGELVQRGASTIPTAPAREAGAEPEAGGEPEPEARLRLKILEPSPDRVEPHCIHFGVCGGCHYQMATYGVQIDLKQTILRETLERAGLPVLQSAGAQAPPPDTAMSRPVLQSWPSPEPWGYRNRVRLRVRRVRGAIRLGYNMRGSTDFLPVSMCPIATPLLWRGAQAVMAAGAGTDRDVARWLEAAAEVELFCDDDGGRLQLTLLCTARPALKLDSFEEAMRAIRALCPELSGAGAVRVDPRSKRAVEALADWGAAGLPYRVGEEEYWIARGAFFQVNRFLLPTLVDLVCRERSGAVAWDLFAGVGLFCRVLARHFPTVTAVEANPVAVSALGRAFARLGPRHRAVQATVVDFLRKAVLERERPDFVALDPPRAGAGEEVCGLLARVAPAEIAYLSCDPTTLARDLAVLTRQGYRIVAVHAIDLFPQTYHLETLVVLRREAMAH